MSDYIDHITKLKRQLRRNMGDLDPVYEDDIIVDGQRHEYKAHINGKDEKAIYTANLFPLDDKSNGPAAMCSYGLRNEKEKHICILQ